MDRKIDISFLPQVNILVDKLFDELDHSNYRDPLYKEVKKMVVRQKKETEKVSEKAYKEDDALYITKDHLADVLWLKHSAYHIATTANKENDVFTKEFHRLLDELFHQFDDFYEEHILGDEHF